MGKGCRVDEENDDKVGDNDQEGIFVFSGAFPHLSESFTLPNKAIV
jgi:hypothetical protein